MVLSGQSPDGRLVEIVELRDHPWFVASQFHPEFKSRPDRPHPLFDGFVASALAVPAGTSRSFVRGRVPAGRRRRPIVDPARRQRSRRPPRPEPGLGADPEAAARRPDVATSTPGAAAHRALARGLHPDAHRPQHGGRSPAHRARSRPGDGPRASLGCPDRRARQGGPGHGDHDMRASIDLRPTRLLLGAGALALAFAIGAGVASAAPTPPPHRRHLPSQRTTRPPHPRPLGSATTRRSSRPSASTAPSTPRTRRPGRAPASSGRSSAAPSGPRSRSRPPTAKRRSSSCGAASAAASSTSVTVTLKDGTTAVFALDASTTVRSAGKAKAISDIKTTGHGIVIGVKNADGTFTAKFVRIAPAK